jgi:murein DD-endopeptidase MepM/ murein hydrolase activator NlpD
LLASDLLGLTNPHLLVQMFKQNGGQLAALLRTRGRLPTAGKYAQRVRYTLPVSGEWFVSNGGTTRETSHSWDQLAQRYAYDLIRMDDSGRTHRSTGQDCTDYLAYGEPVVAPAPGVVIELRDGIRDAPRPGTGWLDWRTPDIRGNYVVLRHDPGEYSLLAHLIPGSIGVRVGQEVARGETIARCGNSGHSTEPHLHFQVQDHPCFYRAVGLPVCFDHLAIVGVIQTGRRYLECNTRVYPALEPAQTHHGPEEARAQHTV